MKYLGITSNKNPYTYTGSGVYWLKHLKKHGKDFSTILLIKTEDKELLRWWCLYFSELFDVINSNLWANLSEETGENGCGPPKGRKQTEEHKKNKGFKKGNKIGLGNKSRTGQHWTTTKEHRKKISVAVSGEKNGMFGKKSRGNTGMKRSQEAIDKQREKIIAYWKAKATSVIYVVP